MITVRRACADDSDAVWRIFQDESAYAGTLQTPYPSRDGRYADTYAMARLRPKPAP